jgi:hypothetical protein
VEQGEAQEPQVRREDGERIVANLEGFFCA